MNEEQLNEWGVKFESYLNENPMDDGSHDITHFKRVWRLAFKLAQDFSTEECDMLVVQAACYFHDIVNYPKNHSKRSQSSVDAAIKAKSILKNMGFPEEKLEQVTHCIEAHSFSANITAQTLEAKIVQDADRMESLGAIGLARTFYTAGLMQSQMFCGEDPFAQDRELDDKKFAVDHFHVKLLKLPQTMQTHAGKKEALRRGAILETFLSDLKQEL